MTTTTVLMFEKLSLKSLYDKDSTFDVGLSPSYQIQKLLNLTENLTHGQQFGRANLASAMSHARSIAAKVLVDGVNPFIFYSAF